LEAENGNCQAGAAVDGGSKEAGGSDASSSAQIEADSKASVGRFGSEVQFDNELGERPECSDHANLQALLFDVPCTTCHPDRE